MSKYQSVLPTRLNPPKCDYFVFFAEKWFQRLLKRFFSQPIISIEQLLPYYNAKHNIVQSKETGNKTGRPE